MLHPPVEITGGKRTLAEPISGVPGPMSAFTNSGHSDCWKLRETKGSFRPQAAIAGLTRRSIKLRQIQSIRMEKSDVSTKRPSNGLSVDLHQISTMLLHIRIDTVWYGTEQRCQTVRPLQLGQFWMQTYAVFGSNFGANRHAMSAINSLLAKSS